MKKNNKSLKLNLKLVLIDKIAIVKFAKFFINYVVILQNEKYV